MNPDLIFVYVRPDFGTWHRARSNKLVPLRFSKLEFRRLSESETQPTCPNLKLAMARQFVHVA